jgi:SAM-dependent methyltransferase
MGIKVKRKKPRMFWASLMYRLHKILPLSGRTKNKLYLNMAWMFDRLSSEMSYKKYAVENHPVRIFQKQFIQKHIEESYTVLDLGCSAGEITNMIAEKARKVIGIDYSKSDIERAKTNHQKSNLAFYHGEALEFLTNNKENFDVLILAHILEHLDNPREFMNAFKNYFRFIYIELPDFDKSFLNHYRKDLNMKLNYTDDDHVSEFDRDELENLLAECHIEIVESVYKFGIQQLWCKVKK